VEGGREIHETFRGGGSYKSLGTSGPGDNAQLGTVVAFTASQAHAQCGANSSLCSSAQRITNTHYLLL
jgi:hypothetical protein